MACAMLSIPTEPPVPPPVLAVTGLGLALGGRRLVDGVCLRIARGQTLALVGESGSGKSLTARAIMGLAPRGAVLAPGTAIQLMGQDIAALPERGLRALRGNRMAMIFQEPMSALNPMHSIGGQLVEAICTHQRLSRPAALARAADLLGEVGLPDAALLARHPHALSGGQRQRVMIAMALANRPDLLIADEPTTALDVVVQAQILALLKDLQARHAMALLLISHDLGLVRRHADGVAVMQAGRIVEQGDAASLFAAPRHPYTRMLLAAEPVARAAPLPPAPDLLTVERLCVQYPAPPAGWRRPPSPATVVADASLAVQRGEAVGIVGESGSGKSSLGLAIMRLIASQGAIAFDGRRIDGLDRAAMRPMRPRLQIVLQDPFAALNPRMSVRQIVEEGLIINGIGTTASDRLPRVVAALADAGLPGDILNRFANEFSGGQRQRISLARALAVQPDFLLLDEPTSALDLSVQAQIIDLLRGLQARRGLSMLFISHDLKVVRALCQRIIVMQAGRIVEAGPAAAILDAPQTPYAQTLVRAAFDLAA
jgi:peptide/nickel transport system ATP-binding protein